MQRAKQLAQLAGHQFGRGMTTGMASMLPPAVAQPTPQPAVEQKPAAQPARLADPVRAVNRVAELNLDPTPPASFTSTGGGTAVLSAPTVKSRPTTAQKIDAVYGVRQAADGVIFAARFEGAGRVLIAGDFNNWSAMSTPMVPADGRPGLWQAKLPLMSGRYRYRFVVDGRWTNDPHNATVEANQFGELNNVVDVA